MNSNALKGGRRLAFDPTLCKGVGVVPNQTRHHGFGAKKGVLFKEEKLFIQSRKGR